MFWKTHIPKPQQLPSPNNTAQGSLCWLISSAQPTGFGSVMRRGACDHTLVRFEAWLPDDKAVVIKDGIPCTVNMDNIVFTATPIYT